MSLILFPRRETLEDCLLCLQKYIMFFLQELKSWEIFKCPVLYVSDLIGCKLPMS